MSEKDRRVARGVWKTTYGWRVYGSVNGEDVSKRLKPDFLIPGQLATEADVKKWRRQWIADLERAIAPDDPSPTPGTFAEDAQRYLDAVKSMPTYDERERHIAEWVELFGRRARRSIKSHEIRAQRERWLLLGPRKRMKKDADGKTVVVDGKIVWESVAEPLGPHAVNLRLRALSNLWRVLDGPRAPNPAREVEECEEPEEQPRALPPDMIDAIFAQAPDRGQATPGEDRPDVSKSKIRARCLRWTGIAPCDLQRVKDHHIQLDQERVWITARRKGKKKKGARAQRVGRWVHLLPEAQAAFRDLVEADAVGDFSVSALNKTFKRWVAAAGYADMGITLYWLRHSVGTDAYAAAGDIKAVQEILGQSDQRSTSRYVRAAVDPRVKAVMEQMRTRILQTPPKANDQKGSSEKAPSKTPTNAKAS